MNNYSCDKKKRRLLLVTQCLKEGLCSAQIADELGVPIRTIQKDIKFIKENQKS